MTTAHPPTSSSRRPPPPCWSTDETVALINAYRDLWYSLHRGNLRAPHWEEVADAVAAMCDDNPPKTSVQCRHKMEKLKKRYRTELQRIGNPNPNNLNKLFHNCSSSWVLFTLMDNMECGRDQEEEDDEEQNDEEGDFCLYPKGIKQAIALPLNKRYQGSVGHGTSTGSGSRSGPGVRIRIPGTCVWPQPTISKNKMLCDDLPPRVRGQYGSGYGFGNGLGGVYSGGGVKRTEGVVEEGDGDVMNEMVAAIERLGDGFVKMEKMKMDMERELELMRMKMERKRTEMIIETQRKMWDSFVKRVMEGKNKRVKRMGVTESRTRD